MLHKGYRRRYSPGTYVTGPAMDHVWAVARWYLFMVHPRHRHPPFNSMVVRAERTHRWQHSSSIMVLTVINVPVVLTLLGLVVLAPWTRLRFGLAHHY
jgi:hypothetical protein